MPTQAELEQLPVELASFIQIANDRSASAEAVTASARALRALALHTHDHTVTAQLLQLSELLSPSQTRALSRWAAHQTSTTLLHAINTSPVNLVAAKTSTLVSRLTAALSSQSTALRPDLRVACSLLRSLTSIATKVALWPADAVAAAATCVAYWAYYRAGAVPGVSGPAPPDRGRGVGGGGASSFGGVMGSFGGGVPKSKSARQLSRSSSSSSLGRGWSDESGDDESSGEGFSTTSNSAALRLEALSALHALATNNSKALHPHWHLFLADSPYMRSRQTLVSLVESDPAPAVRLKACQALTALLSESGAYLAIAEDRPTKASFTSLSSRIGEIVLELHLKLGALLGAKAVRGQAELLTAVLVLAKVVGRNAPYSRLSRPLAQPLATAVLPYINVEEGETAAAACLALAAIVRNACASVMGPRLQMFDLTAVGQACVDLFAADQLKTVKQASLRLLAAVLVGSAEWDVSAHADSIVRSIEWALASEEAQLRKLGCEIVSSPALAALASPGANFDPVTRVLTIVQQDEEVAVQGAAIRALGLLVKSTWFAHPSSSTTLVDVLSVLIDKADQSDSLTSAAAWSIANCSDLLELDHSSTAPALLTRVTRFALTVAAAQDKALPDAVRTLGSVLRVGTLSEASDDVMSQAVKTLCGAVSRGPPKTRWNAAAAIGSALSNPHWSTTSTEESKELIDALLEALGSNKSFKVRTQAAAALMVPQAVASFGGAGALRSARKQLVEAKKVVHSEEDGVPKKEVAHWEQLRRKLDECEAHLARLVDQGSAVAT